MNFYLSYGAGVGSEALRLWLLENNWPHEAVYVDHGCDWPETREFVKTIPDLTIIKPDIEGFDNLYEYCIAREIFPSINLHWCTDKFKVRPFLAYKKMPCIVYLGITFDESKRMRIAEIGRYNHYPLVAMKWTRQDCINYIKSKNMPVPMRSGCWFCPFQNRGRWKQLFRKHPDLYEKSKALEVLVRKPSLAPGGKRLESIVQENQGRLF